MQQKTILYADQGKVLTDGKIYGKVIYLGDDNFINNFSEITEEQYEDILIQQKIEELQKQI
jgi:hypothetical protein